MGQRTQRLGEDILSHLVAGGLATDKAVAIARDVAGVFGKLKDAKDPNPTRIEQLAFIAPEKRTAALALADRAAAGEVIDVKTAGPPRRRHGG